MATKFSIAGRPIGAERCFVIAEAGVNHNGDVGLAKELIRQAKKCGADCVKFQTFSPEELATQAAPKAAYQLKSTDPGESQLDMLSRLVLPESCYPELMELCKKLGVVFLSTPYGFRDVDFLDKLGVAGFKVASGQASEAPFLEHVASKGRPVILSTGMCTLDEVGSAVGTLRSCGVASLAVLHCTTDYPAATSEANIMAMDEIGDKFDVVVGYSDHTTTPAASLAAVARGAKVVEKHFTLDKRMPGPDQSASADPGEFRALVGLIREVESALGRPRKQPTPGELRNAQAVRRSIAARQPIPKGARITAEMLTLLRPATGLKPNLWSSVVGKTASKDIERNSLLSWDDVKA